MLNRMVMLGALWLALASLISLTGCSSAKDQYEKGYADGARDAKPKGFKEGYDLGYSEGARDAKPNSFKEGYDLGYQAAVEQAHPGSTLKFSGPFLIFYRTLIWGGALKLIICLMLALLGFYIHSENTRERFGKVVMATFGATLTLTLTMFFGLSGTIIEALLEPAPTNLALHVVILLISAIGTYGVFEVLFFIILRSRHRPIVEAWLMAAISALLSLLIPALVLFWNSVPNVTNYMGAIVLAGSLLGGLYWIADVALRNRFNLLQGTLK